MSDANDKTKQVGGRTVQQILASAASTASITQNLARDLNRIRTMLSPVDLSLHTQLVDALEPMRRYQDEIAGVFQTQNAITSQLRDSALVNTYLTEVIRSEERQSRWIEDINRVHATWATKVHGLSDALSHLRGLAQFSIADTCRCLAVSDRLLAQIDISPSRAALRIDESAIKFHELSSQLAADFRRFTESVPALADIVALPEWSFKRSSREVFFTNYAIRSALVEEVAPDEEADELASDATEGLADCETLLASVNPGLIDLLYGARAAIARPSPDAARHVLASLRELWSHLLRMLAPDEHVLHWMPKTNSDLLHQGRPTRKARLLYVCREIGSEPLTQFVVRDSEAALELINVFQRVHELEPNLTMEQLRALLLRTESWILYVLRLRS